MITSIGNCSECQKEMDDSETNYGTEDILVCIHCYTDAQNDNARLKNPPQWWIDNYTDASGNCYSDADSGL